MISSNFISVRLRPIYCGIVSSWAQLPAWNWNSSNTINVKWGTLHKIIPNSLNQVDDFTSQIIKSIPPEPRRTAEEKTLVPVNKGVLCRVLLYLRYSHKPPYPFERIACGQTFKGNLPTSTAISLLIAPSAFGLPVYYPYLQHERHQNVTI